MLRAETRRILLIAAWALLAALPVAYVTTQVVATSRNIVFWDEFDTALDLILRIDAGADGREIVQRLFALNNEHRTMTSRLLFALSYWLTGTVNFHVIGAIGNLFFLGACATLVLATHGWERRLRLGVVLAFLMFQLEHFESFIWSGASIDHFQVVMLALIAIVALARGTVAGTGVAIGFGFLATFTLAQGNVVWVVGAWLLAHDRRWKELVAWGAAGAVMVTTFLQGFEFNPSHQIAGVSSGTVLPLARYWLSLLGAPLTLGEARWAPVPGVLLLVLLGYTAARGMARRQPVAWFGALYAVGALSLIALGRAELAGTMVNSRYMVLGALAWSLLVFLLLELFAEANPGRPFRLLAATVPAMVAFNVAANLKFAPMIDSFIEVRDRAATSFEQYGVDGKGITRMHPRDRHADILMKMAEDRGVYRLPVFSHPASFPAAQPSTRMIVHVDELVANERAVTIGGWAMLPGHASRRGEIHVVLRNAEGTLVFSTVTLQRSDVAAAYQEPRWRLSGFRAVIRRERLPAGEFAVGVLIATGEKAEYTMTENRLNLPATPAAAP